MSERRPINSEVERLIDLVADRAAPNADWAGADWPRLIALARHHGLAPVLYARLTAHGFALPPEVRDQLRRLYLASATRNVRLFQELGQILRALQAAKIPVIPLKGACLAEAVYGNIALRPMGDVDVLVKPRDMLRALDVLRSVGYESRHRFDPIAEQTISQHMPPLAKSGRVAVEVHWTIAPPGYPATVNADELAQLWSRASPATIAGVPVLTFSPGDLLLHLCLHASIHHRFDGVGLRAYLDMAQVCHRYGATIDWKRMTACANRWGIANGVRLALQLAEEWTSLTIPAEVVMSLKAAPLDDATANWVRHKVLNGTSLALRKNATRLAAATGLPEKLRALRDAVLPSRVDMAHEYPAPADSWRILVYYPVRFKDLWVRYGRTLWLVARRNHTFMTDARAEARLREYLG